MTTKEFEIQYALGSLTLNTKRELARNPNTLKEILTILSTDGDGNIRWRIACNLNTPVEILTKLSKDKDWYVRYCLINGDDLNGLNNE